MISQNKSLEPAYYLAIKNYKSQTISQIPEDLALDALFYGIKCAYLKGNAGQIGFLHISERNDYVLCFSNTITKKTLNFRLIDIQKMTFNQQSPIFKNKDGYISNMNIYVDKEHHDFIFHDLIDLEQIILALKILRTNKVANDACLDNHIDSIIQNLDQDGNNIIDDEELKKMAAFLGIGTKSIDDLKAALDNNGDKKITKDEVKGYFALKLEGSEAKALFETYATIVNKTNATNVKKTMYNKTNMSVDKENKAMSVDDLINFFHKEQNQNIFPLDAAKIIIQSKSRFIPDSIKEYVCSEIEKSYKQNNMKLNYNDILQITNKQNLVNHLKRSLNLRKSYSEVDKKKIEHFLNKPPDIKLEMDLKEFYQMLHSEFMCVYDKSRLTADLDTSHPLTDYYINSTHNTYLAGHQLVGQSSEKMYGFALQKGYRLVELDCYDGSGDKIEIKHGFTLTSTIYLDEVLTELRNESFVASPYPVILSVENHMDEYHQRIFAYKCKTILKDLYIFPTDALPDYVPSLEDLKNKFIIKVGKKKIHPDVKFVRRVLAPSERNGKIIGIKEFGNKTPVFKKCVTEYNPGMHLRAANNGAKLRSPNIKPIDSFCPQYMENPEDYEVDNADLQKCIGLHGSKYKIEDIKSNIYRPWESCTIKCSVFKKLDDVDRNYFIRATQSFVAKAYPEKFDSSNYNVCKVWMAGGQIAAVNIQAYDDLYLLYNNIFFLQNKNYGYVMKPQKFLKEIKSEADFILYNKPKYKLRFHIFSVKFIGNLIERLKNVEIKRKKDLYIKVKAIGSNKDEDNPEHKITLVDGVIFPRVEGDKYIEYDVYEEDLGALAFIVKYDGEMVGRAVVPYCMMLEGYRKVPLYDNGCNEVSGSWLVCKFTKIGSANNNFSFRGYNI